MAEKEYIERDRLYELGYWHGATPTLDNPFPDGVDAVDTKDIDSIPAADVRPVVTCEECVWHVDDGCHNCTKLGMLCPDDADFYCKYGRRPKCGDDMGEES